MHLFLLGFHRPFISKVCANNFRVFSNILIYNIFCNLWFLCFWYWFWCFSGSFTALQNPLRLWIYKSVCWVILKPQSGHCTIFLNSYIFLGCSSSTIGSSIIGSSITGSFVIFICGLALGFLSIIGSSIIDSPGSTDSFVVLICFGLALDLALDLGLIFSSSYIIVSVAASFTGSSLLIISSICSRVSSSTIFDYLYII